MAKLLNIKKYYIDAITNILAGLDADTIKSLYIVLVNIQERSANRGIPGKNNRANKKD